MLVATDFLFSGSPYLIIMDSVLHWFYWLPMDGTLGKLWRAHAGIQAHSAEMQSAIIDMYHNTHPLEIRR